MGISPPPPANTAGTVLGATVGGLIVAYGPQIAFMVAAAGFFNLPVAAFCGLLGVAVGHLLDDGVTHYATLKGFNDFIAKYIPSWQASYPGKDGQPPASVSPENTNVNKG